MKICHLLIFVEYEELHLRNNVESALEKFQELNFKTQLSFSYQI